MKLRGGLTKYFDPKRMAVSFGAVCLAVSACLPVHAEGDDQVKKLLKQATKLTRASQPEKAEEVLRKAIDIAPQRIEPKVELAYVLIKLRRVREAYDLCFPIAEANPKNSRALAVIGTAFLAAGRFKEARAILYTSLAINHKEDLAWAGYGLLDFYENRIQSSIDNLREAVFNEPSEPDYLFALAQVSARFEHYNEAADAYRRFLSVSKVTDSDRRARIKGLIDFLEYLGRVGGLHLSAGKDSTSVPFTLEDNRPVIKLQLNGKPEELRFVLDTGSAISVLSEETAKRLKIKPVARGGYGRGLGGDGKFPIVYGNLKQLSIGDVSIRNVPIYIRKFQPISRPVDGYIGLSLISKFLTTVDYGTGTFSITKKEADRNDFFARSDMSIPLRLTSSGFLSGEVQLQGVETPLNFIVDTGASVSVISQRISLSEGVSEHVNDEKLRVVGSAGITDDMPTFLLPKISFGKHSVESVKAVALDLDSINEASGFEQSGILGGNFLKNYRLTFDFKNSKVIFVSVNPEKE